MEPLPRGGEFEFVNDIFGGSIPKNFIPAVEKGIKDVIVRACRNDVQERYASAWDMYADLLMLRNGGRVRQRSSGWRSSWWPWGSGPRTRK